MTILPKKPKPAKERAAGAGGAQQAQQQQQQAAQNAGGGAAGARMSADVPSSSAMSAGSQLPGPSAPTATAPAGRGAGRKQTRGAGKKYKAEDAGPCSTGAKHQAPPQPPCAASAASQQPSSAPSDEQELAELESRFCQHLLKSKGLHIKVMKGDGACLFRAVADQVYGDEDMHGNVRTLCMDYMEKNGDHFSQFVTEDFADYVARKRLEHTHGNHVEMQAMAEIFNRPVLVYEYSIEPMNTFQPDAGVDNPPIRVSYHGASHYNSVVDPYGATIGCGLGLPSFHPGRAEATLMREAAEVSERDVLEQAMLKDKLAATDWEATDEEIQQQIKRESYLQWLRCQEATHKAPTGLSSSSAPTRPCATATRRSPKAHSPPVDKPGPSSSRAADTAPPPPPQPALGGDDDAILAQVLALSQQEYYDSVGSQPK